MISMPKSDVLARVNADLDRGHTHLALQRLASLTAEYPDDLEIRARRAVLHRQVGNFPEAGRWGFLTEDVEPSEVAAFERAHRKPWARLHAFNLHADPTPALGPLARERLARLIERAEREGPAPVEWTEAGPSPRLPGSWREDLDLPCLVAVLGGVLVVGLAGVGLVSMIRLIF